MCDIDEHLSHYGLRCPPNRVNPTALLADRPAERLQAVKDAGGLIEASEVADAVLYMLSRPRTVTIHDMIVLPTNFVDA